MKDPQREVEELRAGVNCATVLEKATPPLLLDEDSLSASSEIGGQISERGARRLFDRLVALGAVRELTGRAAFRLYGL